MSVRSVVVVVVVGVILVAIGATLLYRGAIGGGIAPDSARSAPEAAMRQQDVATVDAARALPGAAAPREPAETLVARRLSLRGDLRARVRWISGEDPTRLHRTLHGVPDEDLPAWTDVGDGTTLDLPHGRWIWLCAEVRSATRTATVYRRIAPDATGSSIDLTPETGASVWLLGYERSLDASARSSIVHCVRADGTRGTTAFDGHGFATLSSLPEGLVELQVDDGAGDPSDRSRCRLALGAGSPFDAFVVTLVAPQATSPVTLRMNVLGDGAVLDGSRLVFRRTDGMGSLHPLRNRLVAGTRDAALALPVGAYVAESVPLGALDVAVDAGVLHVTAGSNNVSVRAQASRATTVLELRGVSVTDLPVRVRAIPLDRLDGPGSEFEFIGPYHWSRTRESVYPIPQDVVIEVTGRSDAWLSETRVRIEGEMAAAELAPARRIRFTWFDGPPALTGPVLFASARKRDSIRMTHLARRLSTRNGVDRPSWIGEVTVPRESIDIECVDVDGRVLFAQSLSENRSGSEFLAGGGGGPSPTPAATRGLPHLGA